MSYEKTVEIPAANRRILALISCGGGLWFFGVGLLATYSSWFGALIAAVVMFVIIARFLAELISNTDIQALNKLHAQIMGGVNFAHKDVIYHGEKFVRLDKGTKLDEPSVYRQGDSFFRIEFSCSMGKVTWKATPITLKQAKLSIATDVESYAKHFKPAVQGN